MTTVMLLLLEVVALVVELRLKHPLLLQHLLLHHAVKHGARRLVTTEVHRAWHKVWVILLILLLLQLLLEINRLLSLLEVGWHGDTPVVLRKRDREMLIRSLISVAVAV